MRCQKKLNTQRVGFAMGDMCKSCFQRMKTIIWYNSDDTMEYSLRAFQLITSLSTDVLEELRHKLRQLHPEERAGYSDLSAYENWLKDGLCLVHHFQCKSTTEVIKVVQFDGGFYLIDKNID